MLVVVYKVSTIIGALQSDYLLDMSLTHCKTCVLFAPLLEQKVLLGSNPAACSPELVLFQSFAHAFFFARHSLKHL